MTGRSAHDHPPPDDGTVAYMIEARPLFEDLRQVAAQLAGLLVLAASGARSAAPDHPMLGAASELHKAAAEGLRALRPAAGARRHHGFLIDGAAALERALAAARQHLRRLDGGLEIDAILVPLKEADAALRQAGRLLPGFRMVDLGQGCCAAPQPEGVA